MPTVYLALLIPIIVTGIFYFFRKSEFAWWEFFIPIASVLVAVVISKAIIDRQSVRFDEYWGSTVTAVFEEEPYNYWHSEMCSRQVPCGSHTDSNGNTVTDYCTEWYDCSHQDDVGPSWWAVTNIDEKFGITEQEHDKLVKQFGTRKSVISSHNNYAPRDRCVGSQGTKFEGKRVGETSYVYQTVWSGTDDTRKAYVSQHTYVNKVKASDLSIFNMKVVKDEEADSMGLFKYPPYEGGGLFRMTKGLEYPTILGGNVTEAIQEKFKRLNGKYGPTNQMRLWVLVFENKPMSITQYQQNYWVKGNMNELVVCIGKKGNEIIWSDAFSWALSDELTVAVKNQVLDLYTYKDSLVKRNVPKVLPVGKDVQKKILGKVGEKLPENVMPLPNQATSDTIIKIKSAYPMLTEKTWDDFYNYLNQNLNRFQRRSFKEFDYLRVEPSTGAVIFIYIFALLISVGVNFIVINNEIGGEDNGEDRWKRNKYY
jgi:hypothetical protein